MFKKALSCALVIMFLFSQIPVYAADPNEMPGKPTVSNRIAGYMYIPAGTVVNCELITPMDSGKTKTGERILFKTSDNIIVNNLTVIPRGSMGEGVVTKVKKAGGFGSGGAVEFQAKHIKAINNVEVPATFKMNESGGSKSGWVVPSFLLVSVFAGFIQGSNQKIPASTPFQVIVSTDTDLGGTKEELEQVVASQNTMTVSQVREQTAKKAADNAIQTAKAFPEIMTVEQLAEYLQIDRTAVDDLLKTGAIKSTTIGNSVRIKKKDVDAYLGS
ncbi:hypothetical protein AXX12_02655 [Anaerosporomusa subterranea]|uniref:Helix-turn-helix domain-containing protein n=1 Tax=Anaerosporomusa subterranea TaxID=1794912 RepID=A0A154BU66_ANASB|nr:helix-turn-helix domain-containing protein [Anaerosporomusa subterranea]KYZ77058.1 hypothetical protein AXX12_02655 [Anaerosporomusa subterranea]